MLELDARIGRRKLPVDRRAGFVAPVDPRRHLGLQRRGVRDPAIEALARCHKSARGQSIRSVGLELERLANHVGDLAALAGDVAYQPGAAFFGLRQLARSFAATATRPATFPCGDVYKSNADIENIEQIVQFV